MDLGRKLAQRSPQLQPDPQRLPSAAQVASQALISTPTPPRLTLRQGKGQASPFSVPVSYQHRLSQFVRRKRHIQSSSIVLASFFPSHLFQHGHPHTARRTTEGRKEQVPSTSGPNQVRRRVRPQGEENRDVQEGAPGAPDAGPAAIAGTHNVRRGPSRNGWDTQRPTRAQPQKPGHTTFDAGPAAIAGTHNVRRGPNRHSWDTQRPTRAQPQ